MVTVAAFFAAWHFGLTSPTQVYDLFGEMLAAMSVVAFVFCIFLLIKAGPHRPPSPPHPNLTVCS